MNDAEWSVLARQFEWQDWLVRIDIVREVLPDSRLVDALVDVLVAAEGGRRPRDWRAILQERVPRALATDKAVGSALLWALAEALAKTGKAAPATVIVERPLERYLLRMDLSRRIWEEKEARDTPEQREWRAWFRANFYLEDEDDSWEAAALLAGSGQSPPTGLR